MGHQSPWSAHVYIAKKDKKGTYPIETKPLVHTLKLQPNIIITPIHIHANSKLERSAASASSPPPPPPHPPSRRHPPPPSPRRRPPPPSLRARWRAEYGCGVSMRAGGARWGRIPSAARADLAARGRSGAAWPGPAWLGHGRCPQPTAQGRTGRLRPQADGECGGDE